MKRIISFILFIVLPSSFFRIFSQKQDMFRVHLEAGYSAKITKTGDKMRGPQFFVTPTCVIGNNTHVGIGAGIKLFKDAADETVKSFPVYVNAFYKFNSSKVAPFVEGKAGYSFMNRKYSGKLRGYYKEYPEGVDFNTETRGGLFFSPSAGVLFPVMKNHALSLSLAYVLARDSYKSHGIQLNKTFRGTDTHHSVALRVGYIF